MYEKYGGKIMSYEIKLGEAIGDIKIGMPRSEVKKLFKNLKEWTELPYGYTHVIQYDINDDFQIVYDEDNCLYRNLNKELVLMEKIETKADKEELKRMLENHVKYTDSKKAAAVLSDFEEEIKKFKKIIPEDYKKLISATAMFEEQGMTVEQAQIEAFYKCTREE